MRRHIQRFASRFRERPHLRQWLIITLILGLFSLIVVYSLYHERQLIEVRASKRLQSEARIIDDNLSAQLGIANTVLHQLIRDIPVWRDDSHAEAGMTRRMKALADTLPGIRSLSIVDARGRVRLSSRDSLRNRDISTREYFEKARRLNDREVLYVSQPFRGDRGNYLITLTRSYTDAQGNFAGLAMASLDSGYFSTLLNSVLHAADVRSAVFHEDGHLFIMAPRHLIAAEETVPADALVAKHIASGRSSSLLTGYSPISHDQRIAAVRTIRPPHLKMDKGLVIAISRHQGTVFGDWYEITLLLGSGMFLVINLGIGLQTYHQRAVQRYEEAAQTSRIAIQAAEQRFTTAFNEAPIGILLMCADSGQVQVNHALADMLGYSIDALQAAGMHTFMPPEDAGANQAMLKELLSRKRDSYQHEVRLRHHNGHHVWVLLSVCCVLMPQGRLEYVIKHIQDITLLKQQASALEMLAHYDRLTGLPNRTLLADRMQQAIAQATRHSQIIAFGIIDLDEFKPVNDTYGHEAGDEVLKLTATRMLECLRGEDSVARIGGDEFVFLLGSVRDEAECMQVIERMRAAIEEPILLSCGVTVAISASFGFSLYPHDSDNTETLLRYADRAMYVAKNSGSHYQRFSAALTTVTPQASADKR